MSGDVAVSVVMSTRNRAGYLSESLSRLAAQQGDIPFEVIVIDNGSTDGTAALLEQWCRRDPRFRSAQEPQPGLSRGKNAGIRLARAPLLLFTDDDMRVAPRWMASYHAFFAGRDGLVVCGGPIVPIPHDLGRWPDWLDESALSDAGMLQYREQRALGKYEYAWGGNMAIPRRVFDRVGLWKEDAGLQGDARVTGQDSAFFEDTELQDRARGAGGSIWFCPAASAEHRTERRLVTPRRIASTAFARGRNDVWVRGPAPHTNVVGGLVALAASLIRWAWWVMRRRWSAARLAAFAAGRALDLLRAGRGSDRVFRVVARGVFPVRALLLRMMPDEGGAREDR
jgi:glucosyl-dolichyl phosphate glucuronosyltransferase